MALWCLIVSLFLLAASWADADECGKPVIPASRIVGGKETVPGAWPWQVLVKEGKSPACSGTLIHPEWVVTTASCTAEYKDMLDLVHVALGIHDIRYQQTGVEYSISKLLIHPDFSMQRGEGHMKIANDIALIKVDRPVFLDKMVQPICLPESDPAPGTECYITGWGSVRQGDWHMTNILHQGKMKVVPSDVCQEKNKDSDYNQPISKGMICAGSDSAGGVSGCAGDSGAPLACLNNGRWELQGVMSTASNNCDSWEAYTVFSRITHFKTWIDNTLANE